MKNKPIFILVLCFIQSILFGQYSIHEIKSEDYLKDFDIAVDILKKQHPNLYRFDSEASLNRKFDSLRNNLKQNPTFTNFYFNFPNKVIKDGHTNVEINDNYLLNFFEKNLLFPLPLYVNNKKVYVNGFNKYNIENASVIKSINGVNMDDYLKTLPISSDGSISVENFDLMMFNSLFLPPQNNQYAIHYISPAGEKKNITIDAEKFLYWNKGYSQGTLPSNTSSLYPVYGIELNRDTYYLYIHSFSIDESAFYEMLKKYFNEMRTKKIKNLIIDIRNNVGGALSNIPLLYSFLSQKEVFINDYKYGTKRIEIQAKDYLIDDSNRNYTDQDVREFNNFMSQRFNKDSNSEYYYGNSRLDDSFVRNYPKDPNSFNGNVYLLTSNSTFSAASYFAQMFKSQNRGKIIGKETGSCSNFTTAAFFLYYELPYTKSKLKLPVMEVFFNTEEAMVKNKIAKCKGVLPDYTVSDDFFQKSLQSNKDPEIEFTLDLIKK